MTAPTAASSTANASQPPTGASLSVATTTRGARTATPDRLRAGAVMLVLVVAAVGLLAWFVGDRLVSTTDRIADRTGVVLISSQQVSASIAEADAAARAVQLAGPDGDPAQRRIYQEAVERASVGLERVARSIGDDETSHDVLAQAVAAFSEYTGAVETARAEGRLGSPGAAQTLDEATSIVNDEVLPPLRTVAERAETRFVDDLGTPLSTVVPIALGVLAIVLLLVQFAFFRRFNRLINPPLLLATAVLVALCVFVFDAWSAQRSALEVADRDAYAAIAINADIQQVAYRYQTAVLTGVGTDELSEVATEMSVVPIDEGLLERAAARDLVGGDGLLHRAVLQADSSAERAGAAGVMARWQRYLDSTGELAQVRASNDGAAAVDLARGPVTSAFNGFNVASEAALLTNSDQFTDAVDVAQRSLRWTRLAIAIGAIAAALLIWLGFSLRIGEYR